MEPSLFVTAIAYTLDGPSKSNVVWHIKPHYWMLGTAQPDRLNIEPMITYMMF
jgi:hypothetical protein